MILKTLRDTLHWIKKQTNKRLDITQQNCSSSNQKSNTEGIRKTEPDVISPVCVPRGLDMLRKKGKSSIPDLPIDSVNLSLQDLIGYFQPPGDHLEHEDKQNLLRSLKNRQNLFQEEVNRWVNI